MISLIFLVLALVIVIVSCKNLDRGFILFLCFRLILNYTIGLSFIPGLPNLQLEMLMCIYFIFRYYPAYKKYVKFNPLFSAINLLIISVAISSVFTEADFESEIMRSFNNLSKLDVFIIPIWLFACVFKEKDKAFLAWSIIISIFLNNRLDEFEKSKPLFLENLRKAKEALYPANMVDSFKVVISLN